VSLDPANKWHLNRSNGLSTGHDQAVARLVGIGGIAIPPNNGNDDDDDDDDV